MDIALPLRVAPAGAGMISRQHLLAWQKLEPHVQVVAICDPDRSRGESRAKEFKIEDIYDTAGSLFSGAEFDALDVVSPREPRCLPEHPRAVPKTTNAHTGRGRIPPPRSAHRCSFDGARELAVPTMVQTCPAVDRRGVARRASAVSHVAGIVRNAARRQRAEPGIRGTTIRGRRTSIDDCRGADPPHTLPRSELSCGPISPPPGASAAVIRVGRSAPVSTS